MKPAELLLCAFACWLLCACNGHSDKQAEIREQFRETADSLQKNTAPADERRQLYTAVESRLKEGEGSSRLQQCVITLLISMPI